MTAHDHEHSRIAKIFRRRTGKSPVDKPNPAEKAAKKERRWSRKANGASSSQVLHDPGQEALCPSPSADTVPSASTKDVHRKSVVGLAKTPR